MQLFLDGTLKIIAKIDSSDEGYYLVVASNARKTKQVQQCYTDSAVLQILCCIYVFFE